jgi:hypothetical protein
VQLPWFLYFITLGNAVSKLPKDDAKALKHVKKGAFYNII